MVSVFLQANSEKYDQISEPLYFHEEGPYLTAFSTRDSSPVIFLYEFLDMDVCLERPQEIPAIFMDAAFLKQLSTTYRFTENDENSPVINYEFCKIVPRTFAYKQQAKEICMDCPGMASQIFFMTESGALATASAVLSKHKAFH